MKVSASIDIAVPPTTAWATISDFNGLPGWIFTCQSSTLDGSGIGAIRHLVMSDGGKISERLETLDEDAMSLSYSITESALPVLDYVSTISISGEERTCTVDWTIGCEPNGIGEDQLKQIVGNICSGGVKALKTHCELGSTTKLKKIGPN